MPSPSSHAAPTPPLDSAGWLVRISEAFEPVVGEILHGLGATTRTDLGSEYHLIKTNAPEALRNPDLARYLRWNLPMDHMWPCSPPKMEGFIEKAAQTLLKKFGPRNPQGIFVGQLNPGSPDPYFKKLASNLRGRALQIFPKLKAEDAEKQDPSADTLFCLVGREGLFCGMQSPRDSNGLYPGGSKFINLDNPQTISRAGAKIAEALHHLLMFRPPLPKGSHWLELGACPGGMTSELLARQQRVTAIDRAPLDARLDGHPGLTFIHSDVAAFRPAAGRVYDAMLSDLNGPPQESITHIARYAPFLKLGGIVIFTLKTPRVEELSAPSSLVRKVISTARQAGLSLITESHLPHNRHEFTLFFEKH
jgi:23S rRNA (cytidine2498-2'-O)-methyltransferase